MWQILKKKTTRKKLHPLKQVYVFPRYVILAGIRHVKEETNTGQKTYQGKTYTALKGDRFSLVRFLAGIRHANKNETVARG